MMRPAQMAVLACAALLLVNSGVSAGEEEIRLTEGAGRDLVVRNCVMCHSLDYIPMNGPLMTRARWEATIRKMIDKMGAPISDADAKQMLEYLSASYSAAQ